MANIEWRVKSVDQRRSVYENKREREGKRGVDIHERGSISPG